MIIKLQTKLFPANSHGFYSRYEIDSDGNKSELNYAYSDLADKEHVEINRSKIQSDLRIQKNNLIDIKQIHSENVLTIRNLNDPKGFNGDGMVTNLSGVGLAILTADCAPILFSDKASGVIGIAHAGWKGALLGITNNTIKSMVRLGAQRNQISACVGPCISKDHYEVGLDLKSAFLNKDSTSSKYFSVKNEKKFLFDLPGFILNSIKQSGIKKVGYVNICTYKNTNFFSYRRDLKQKQTSFKRNISVIKL